MNRNTLRVALVVVGIPVLWLCCVGGCLYRDYRDRENVYETRDAQGEAKASFIEAFMPGVRPDDVLRLSYARRGGREPPFIGVMEMTAHGLARLRAHTEHEGTGTFADYGVTHLYGGQPEIIHGLAARVKWWSLDESQVFEARQVAWKGDHVSAFFIPTNGGPVYVEAVVH